jgi:hypothetical protein
MRLLTELAISSFVTLLAVAIWLWRSLHPKAPKPAGNHPVSRASFRIVHPRQDLAVGLVPPAQAVRRRASRAEMNSASVPQPNVRPDRAYARQDFGDLSDPDPRKIGPVGLRRQG